MPKTMTAALLSRISDNSNASLVTPTLGNGTLTLEPASGATGLAEITVRATDSGGLFVEDTFEVTVEAPPTPTDTPTDEPTPTDTPTDEPTPTDTPTPTNTPPPSCDALIRVNAGGGGTVSE